MNKVLKNMVFVGHQGDVMLFEIEEFPEGPRVQNELTSKFQLALGELSGHNHVFENGAAAVDLFKIDSPEFADFSFFETKAPAKLVHGLIKGFKGTEADKDYHSEIVLKPNTKYISSIVEETDWLGKVSKKVVD